MASKVDDIIYVSNSHFLTPSQMLPTSFAGIHGLEELFPIHLTIRRIAKEMYQNVL